MRNTIEITFEDGHSEAFEIGNGNQNHHDHDGKALPLYKGNSCVGIYNIDQRRCEVRTL